MKIKFFKTLAIACVLCMTFATLTAFADVTVTTTTDYDYEADATAMMTITTTVAGLTENGEITYYVEDATTKNIVYIDQATAEGETAGFTFTASKEAVLAATAKHGSDKGYSFPTFEFNDGCNYLTQGTATVTETTGNWKVESVEHEGYIFQGKVSGAAKGYGITIEINGVEEKLYAMGCDIDGTFAIVVQGITEAEANTAEKFAE